MEAALVSAATGALKPVLGKLATLVGDEYKRLKWLRGEIKFLMDELTAMQAFLLRMSEEEDPDEQDKVWMTAVRELSYDMEDSIDDFMQDVDEKDTKPDGFLNKIKHSMEKLRKMKTHGRIGVEIQDLKKQVIEVGERNARYKTREAFAKTINSTVDHRALAIFEHASRLVGIEKPKADIIKLLTRGGSGSAQQKPRIVSIVGGMGKTTLANQVYEELKGTFDCRAFVSVSRNPDVMNILRTILSEVSNKNYAHTEAGSIQQIIPKITQFLKEKSFFIVVDDIWDVETWDVIQRALCRTNNESIIITTTRKNDVAKECSSSQISDYIYNIRPLDDMDSMKLFHRRLFYSEEDCPPHLQKVSEEIIKKCAGLPLAIITISGLLASIGSTEEDWNEVNKSIGCGLDRNESVLLNGRNDSVKGMFKILSLSYFDLPPHIKTCLLYLSIYPENSVIKRGDLIRRWIAEGFIHREGKYTVHEVGQRCFNELVNRSLIQPEGLDKFHRVERFRVHDTILDFIIFKSTEVNFVTLVGLPNVTKGTRSKVRRLSLQDRNRGNSLMPTGLALSHVRSVSVFGNPVDIPSLDKFIHVRVVDFGHCDKLTNHHLKGIGRLFQLRYLNLSWTRISKLPEQIGKLQYLEMLDLRGTCVCELPASIINLGKLVHLLIVSGVKLPAGIAKMQALEILKHVRVSIQSFGFMQELGQLKNMRKLALDFSEFECATEDTMELVSSSLHNLGTQNLRSLTISSGSNFLQGPFSPTQLISLREFYTLASTIPQVPQWLGSLINLQKLRLELERVGQEDMCILRCLPVLLILDMVACEGSLAVGGEVGFRCLTVFGYTVLSGEMKLKFEVGSMPKLENLTVLFRPDESETDGDFDFGIENLPCLTGVKCEVRGYDGSRVDSARTALERATSTHPNHPTLSFEKSCYSNS
uniref:Uncharacterized protein n=1 Tax=Avena sativa TaxID=4498 RepID=A0ACD5TDU0_AVESA